MFSLRDATPEDLEFQKRLYASTREEEMNAAGFPQEMRAAFIDMQFRAQTLHYTTHYIGAQWSIIEVQGQSAGRIILYRADDHLNITDICLLPEYRGQGLGTAVLELVFAQARAERLPVRLHAYTGERAIQLYQRLGFRDLHDKGMHTELEWRPSTK